MKKETIKKSKKEIIEKNSEEKPFEIFDIVNNIYDKRNGLLDEEVIKQYYNPWLINLALSQNQDTVAFAQIMNENWNLDSNLQYGFLYHGIDSRKRFAKWARKDKENDEKIKLLKEFYGYSNLRARETISLIDQLNLWNHIKSELNKGGSHGT